MSRSASDWEHYHKTYTKAVQTETPAGRCVCSKVLVKDVSVQCDLNTSNISKAKHVTFSPEIGSRGDIPDESQPCKPPVALTPMNNDPNVNGVATQYGRGDEVPWSMSTQLLSQLFEQEEDDDTLREIQDDLQSPSRDNDENISHVVADLVHVSEVERDVTDPNLLCEPQIAEDYFDIEKPHKDKSERLMLDRIWKAHPWQHARASNKDRHLAPSVQSDTISRTGVFFDCRHCENSCICVARLSDDNVVVPDCDCLMEDGLCVKGLRFNILQCIRQAVKRHSEKQCGSDCTGSDNCVEQYARELSLGLTYYEVRPRCDRRPACGLDGCHLVHPEEIPALLMSNNFDLMPQTRALYSVVCEQYYEQPLGLQDSELNVIGMSRDIGGSGMPPSKVTHFLSDKGSIQVLVQDKLYNALVDTGACEPCLSGDCFRSLELGDKEAVVTGSRVYCIMANGARQKAACDITIPIFIDGKRYRVLFHVIEGLTSSIILGRSFLQEFSMTLDFTMSNPPNRTVAARLEGDVQVPGKSEVCVSARLPLEVGIWNRQEGVFHASPSLSQQLRATNMSLVTVNSGLIPVCLINLTNQAKLLTKGTVLGTYSNHIPERISSAINSVNIAPTISENDNVGNKEVAYMRGEQEDIEVIVGEDQEPDTRSQGGECSLDFDLSNSIFTEEQKEICQKLLQSRREAFVVQESVRATHLVKHHIDLVPGTIPSHAQPLRMAPPMRRELEKVIDEQISKGIIEPASDGPWASPAFLVPKPRKSSDETIKYRLVSDYRVLNAATIPQAVCIPRIDQIVDAVGETKPKYFTAFDLKTDLNQIEMEESSKEYTSFITNSGKYRKTKMSKDLRNSPATFQRMVDMVLSGIRFRFALAYLDDIIIWSHSFEEHMQDLCDVLDRVIDAGLTLKPAKAEIGRDRIQFLGHILTPEGIHPTPENVQKLADLPRPTTLRQTRRFLSLAGYYRKFCPAYGLIAQPLYELMKKQPNDSFQWGPSQEKAFQSIRSMLTSSNLLLYPDFDKTFIVSTDSSDWGMGASLCQKADDGELRPVAFWAAPFKGSQLNYSVGDKEMAAIYFAVLHWRVYLEGASFEIHTDHKPLISRITTKGLDSSARVLRWVEFLQRFQFSMHYVAGSANVVPDFMSRIYVPVANDRTPLYSPQRRTAASPLPKRKTEIAAASSAEPEVTSVSVLARAPWHVWGNQEIQNCELTLEDNEGVTRDQLVHVRDIKQKVKPDNRKRQKYVLQLEVEAKERVMTLSLDPEELREAQKTDRDCQGITTFVKDGTLPKDAKEARNILLREEDYFLHEGILFRFSPASVVVAPLEVRLVVPKRLRLHFLRQNHDAPHSGHMGFHKMMGKMRPRLFWRGMSVDIKDYVDTCEICCETKRATRPIRPPLVLRDASPRPLYCVNMDFLERLPVTELGNRHIFCLIDYYSRYLICWPQKDLKAETLIEKFAENVVYRHGSVHTIVSDNGSAFISDAFKQFCARYGISHSFTSSLHPMASGLVERVNRSVLGIIRAYIDQHQKKWDTLLPALAFAINSSKATTTGVSPYLLLHGFDPILPDMNQIPDPSHDLSAVSEKWAGHLEQQMQAHRFAMESLKKNAEQMKDRYDKRAWEPNLSPGDIVFVYMPRVKNQAVKLKLSKVYHGPFAIVKYHTATTVYLKDIRSGKFVLKPVAIGRLKKMGKNNIRTQEQVDQEAAEGEDPLEVGDIPLDSLIPDTHQQPDLNRAPPGRAAEPPVGQKDMVPPGDDMDGKGDRVSNGNQSDRAASAPLISEQMELPNQTTNPGGNRTSRRTPMGYRIHKGVKSDDLSPVESVLDVARIRDEMHVKVQFVDGSVMWIPITYLNDVARKKLVSPDVSIREMPNLRPKRK